MKTQGNADLAEAAFEEKSIDKMGLLKEEKKKVITIDGPAGSGKSTVAAIVARFLGWTYVTTGAIYRTVAWMLKERNTDEHDLEELERIVKTLDNEYRQDSNTGRVFVGTKEVTNEIRSPENSERASIVAQSENVRKKLFDLQRKVVFSVNGAVVDGRDMGTIIFPDAPLKIFLTAAPEERAKRRYNELIAKGQNVDMDTIIREVHERDYRDASRKVAPMQPAADAIILDCTTLKPEDVASIVLNHACVRGLVAKASSTVL